MPVVNGLPFRFRHDRDATLGPLSSRGDSRRNPLRAPWQTVQVVVLLIIFGMRHPEPLDTETELDGTRRILAFVILLVFLLSFTPAPFPGMNWETPKPQQSNPIAI